MNEKQNQIVEMTGAQDWDEVIEWFGGMSASEISAAVEDIWPGDPNNDNLTDMLVGELL